MLEHVGVTWWHASITLFELQNVAGHVDTNRTFLVLGLQRDLLWMRACNERSTHQCTLHTWKTKLFISFYFHMEGEKLSPSLVDLWGFIQFVYRRRVRWRNIFRGNRKIEIKTAGTRRFFEWWATSMMWNTLFVSMLWMMVNEKCDDIGHCTRPKRQLCRQTANISQRIWLRQLRVLSLTWTTNAVRHSRREKQIEPKHPNPTRIAKFKS